MWLNPPSKPVQNCTDVQAEYVFRSGIGVTAVRTHSQNMSKQNSLFHPKRSQHGSNTAIFKSHWRMAGQLSITISNTLELITIWMLCNGYVRGFAPTVWHHIFYSTSILRSWYSHWNVDPSFTCLNPLKSSFNFASSTWSSGDGVFKA